MIHIVFGAATAGSLKQAFCEMKQDQVNDIIAFDDIYSIGPLLHLHEQEGQEKRIEWLRHVMSNEYGYFDDMVTGQHRMFQQIKIYKMVLVSSSGQAIMPMSKLVCDMPSIY